MFFLAFQFILIVGGILKKKLGHAKNNTYRMLWQFRIKKKTCTIVFMEAQRLQNKSEFKAMVCFNKNQ